MPTNLFRKDVVRPGEWVVRTPEGLGLFSASQERVNRWAEVGNKMLSAGLNIPVIWEHTFDPADPSGLPFTEAERSRDHAAKLTKHNAGFVRRYEVSEDGRLQAELEIPLDEDAARIGTVVRDVSPLIEESFIDGDGNLWQDAICHVALTNQPVVVGQEKFTRIAASRRIAFCQLSRGMGPMRTQAQQFNQDDDTDESSDDEFEDLGLDDDNDGVENTVDDDDDDNGLNDGGEAAGMVSPPVSSQLVEALRMHGMIIPPTTTLMDLPNQLMTALHTSKATKNLGKMDAAEDAASKGAMNPMAAPNKIPRNGMREEQQATVAMSQAKTDALIKRMLTNERTQLSRRVANCVRRGQLSPALAKKFVSTVAGARLSLMDNGDVQIPSGIELALEVAESVPVASHFSADNNPAEFEVHDNPEFFDDPSGQNMTAEQIDKTLDEAYGTV